jgi:hypothetical protein
MAVQCRQEHFQEKACPGLDPGWTPVFRRKCDHSMGIVAMLAPAANLSRRPAKIERNLLHEA